MHRPIRFLALTLVAALALPLAAQQNASPAMSDSASVALTAAVPALAATAPQSLVYQQAAATGAPLAGLRAGVHAPRAAAPDRAAMAAAASHANLGQSRAMMAVGAAGIIVGAIIGGTPGTVIMVGGALVGLKGLYDYLQ